MLCGDQFPRDCEEWKTRISRLCFVAIVGKYTCIVSDILKYSCKRYFLRDSLKELSLFLWQGFDQKSAVRFLIFTL